MITVRNLLLAVALVFGIIETVDIPHTGIPAAVFAILFFACAALAQQIFAMTLGTIGLAAVAGVLFERVRRWQKADQLADGRAAALGNQGQ